MYKSTESYKYLSLNKEDLYDLEKLIRKKMSESTEVQISINTPKRDFKLSTIYDFDVETNKIKLLDHISFRFSQKLSDTDKPKSVKILMHEYKVEVKIEGYDEVWVNGLSIIIKNFLNEKRTFIAQFYNLIPYVVGVMIGASGILLKVNITALTLFIAILSGITALFVFLNVFSNKVLLPPVRINLKAKEEKNWMLIIAIIGMIVGILTLLVAILAL